MKFDFKLNTDAPGQHTAILVIAFVAIWISVIDAIKAPDDAGEYVIRRKGPYAVTGETLYQNPQMGWIQKRLCRGYQRSWFCRFKNLNPRNEMLISKGVRIPEGPPKKNVVLYRGPLNKNRAINGRIVFEKNN